MFAERFGNSGAQFSSKETPRGYPFISAEELKKREGAAQHNAAADHFEQTPAEVPETLDVPASSRTLGGFFRKEAGVVEVVEEVEERNITEEKNLSGDDSDEGAYAEVVVSGQ